jgi:hypothetical protein
MTLVLPDFTRPAFSVVVLATLQLRDGVGARRSDYRCQFRWVDDVAAGPDADVRVYFVGTDQVSGAGRVPALVVFLADGPVRERCRERIAFELREGVKVTATGVVDSVSIRGAR